MDTYELIIKDENVDEVFNISLVENPAISRNFIYLSKEETQFATIDNEKRLLVGPILIPDLLIRRYDDETKQEYEVFFSKLTIFNLAQDFIMKGYQGNATLQHSVDIKNDIILTQSWIVENSIRDKSNFYNLTLPVGTWCGVFKVQSDEIWNSYIKTGKVKGFSVECSLEKLLTKMSKVNILDKDLKDVTDSELEEFFKKIMNKK